LLSGLVDLDEYTVVDLQESQELQDFPGFRSNLVDTTRSEELGELLKIMLEEVLHTL
jgi:hypothetical protein